MSTYILNQTPEPNPETKQGLQKSSLLWCRMRQGPPCGETSQQTSTLLRWEHFNSSSVNWLMNLYPEL